MELVKSKKTNGENLHLCEQCGFGYKEKETAQQCETWCSTYKSCNFEITQKAVYIP